MQTTFGHIGLDIEFPPLRDGRQCRIDFTDGLGDAFLCIGHRRDGRGGIPFDLRLAHLGSLLFIKAFGIGLDPLRVESRSGIDGKADALGKSGNLGKEVLDTFQLGFAVLRVDGQAIVEAAFLAVLGTEHTVDLVHHVLDVRHSRRERGFRLHKLAHSIPEGDNLLGALRGIDIDGIIDLIVLFLSHGICCSL